MREYLLQGYAINEQRFDKNAAELQQALALIKKNCPKPRATHR
nr:hypothetical protein [Psychrobacter sp. KH172YL61]